MGRLRYPLAVGSVFGFWTAVESWVFNQPAIREPLWLLNLAGTLLLPGYLAGFIANGNIHVYNPWVATIANFVFYFGLTWLVLKALAKLRTRGQKEAPKR